MPVRERKNCWCATALSRAMSKSRAFRKSWALLLGLMWLLPYLPSASGYSTSSSWLRAPIVDDPDSLFGFIFVTNAPLRTSGLPDATTRRHAVLERGDSPRRCAVCLALDRQFE